MRTAIQRRPALFLDRDGIIVAEVKGAAPKRPEEVQLSPRMVAVLQELTRLGLPLVLISNQPDYALGQVSLADREQIECVFLKQLASADISLSGIYYCYHHPKGVVPELSILCRCRKPEPGLILRAHEELTIDLSQSYFIGNRATDIKAGKLAGVATILFDERDSQSPFLMEHKITPDFTIHDPHEVLTIIHRVTKCSPRLS